MGNKKSIPGATQCKYWKWWQLLYGWALNKTYCTYNLCTMHIIMIIKTEQHILRPKKKKKKKKKNWGKFHPGYKWQNMIAFNILLPIWWCNVFHHHNNRVTFQDLNTSPSITLCKISYLGFQPLGAPYSVPLFIAALTWYYLLFTCSIQQQPMQLNAMWNPSSWIVTYGSPK